MTDLETVAMDELWEEIARRCEHAVLHIVRPCRAASLDRNPSDRGSGAESAFWVGDRYACIGLCRTLEELLIQKAQFEESPQRDNGS